MSNEQELKMQQAEHFAQEVEKVERAQIKKWAKSYLKRLTRDVKVISGEDVLNDLLEFLKEREAP
jgi:hypothetical protein